MNPERMTDALRIALLVARALEALGVPYAIGGSVASSLAGEPRSTLDVDIAVALPVAQIPALAEALGPDFYFDRKHVAAAAAARSSANLCLSARRKIFCCKSCAGTKPAAKSATANGAT